MFSGGWLILIFLLLTVWLSSLIWSLITGLNSSRLSKAPRWRRVLTYVGLALCVLCVGGLWVLTVSWFSPTLSQRFNGWPYYFTMVVVFGSTVASLPVGLLGVGIRRALAVGTSLVAGTCWLWISFVAGLSMGPVVARHPVRYLIPDGYIGWVVVSYNEPTTPPLPVVKGEIVCKFPVGSVLRTSSALESGWAKDEFFYYSVDGSLHRLKDTSWGGGGMIWDGSVSSEQPTEGVAKQFEESYFIGSEEQFHRGPPRPSPGQR
jgi:hypothetical protein